MKRRAKIKHWISDMFGNPSHLEKEAHLEDRRLDNKLGARL